MIFAATGVTEGSLLKGVRFFGEGTRTSSIILTLRRDGSASSTASTWIRPGCAVSFS